MMPPFELLYNYWVFSASGSVFQWETKKEVAIATVIQYNMVLMLATSEIMPN